MRAIELGDDAVLDHAHRVMRRAALEDGRTWTTMWSRERMATALRQPPAGEVLFLLGAYDGPVAPESLVGVAFVHRDLAANTDLMHLDCWVEPELRRRGIGSALVDAVVGLARSTGCTRLRTEASFAFADADDAPALLFARAHGFHVDTVEVFRELALPVPEDVPTALVGLDEDGAVVGAGEVTVNLQANTHFAWCDVQVAPSLRRRGIGSALVRAAEEVVRASGARFALLASHYPFAERETHGYRRFAEVLGYTPDLDEIYRVLTLPVHPDLLERLAEEAAVHHRGYRLATWVYDVPERYLDSWLDVHNKLGSEAPSGVVQFEEDGMDAASWGEEVARLRSLGREVRTTVAISPDDEVVAYNDLVLQDNDTGRVSQWGTLVRADHRGRRLGLAVKVAGLRSLAEAHPDRTEVHTTNAEVNAQMIGINEVLGFRAVAVHPGFYREV